MGVDVLLVAASGDEGDLVSAGLEREGHRVTCVSTPAEALAHARAHRPALVIVDLAARQKALRLIRTLRDRQHAPAIVAISAPGRADIARSALLLGVTDLITRPLSISDLVDAAANTIELGRLESPPVQLEIPEEAEQVLGDSEAMQGILTIVRAVASLDCPVLIVGETGTGRDTIAGTIHSLGSEVSRPLLVVDCAMSDVAQLEDDLLAQMSRSNTDAARPGKRGASRRSATRAGATAGEQGTLYFKHVDRLAPSLQDKVLGCLEQRQKLGEAYVDGVDRCPRLVSSTDPSVIEAVEEGRFRRDLFDWLATVRLDLPPLRERAQDIPLLATYYLKQACARNKLSGKALSHSAATLLQALPWRGNARELRMLIERLVVVVARGTILLEDVLEHVDLAGSESAASPDETLRQARARFERGFLLETLRRHHGRMGEAARDLGIERTNLYRRMKRLGIESKRT